MLRLVAICAVLGLVCGGFPKELLKRRMETALAERLMGRLMESRRTSEELTCNDEDPWCAENVCVFKFLQQNLLGFVIYYDSNNKLEVYVQSGSGDIYLQEMKRDFDFSQLPYTSKSFEINDETFKIIVGDIDDSDDILHVESLCLDKQ